MPKQILPLTDMKVKAAKPGDKAKYLFDGGGLYLVVTPKGGKLWHFKYRFRGRADRITFGKYPEVSISDARGKRDDARKQIAAGVNPKEARKAQKASRNTEVVDSFEAVAREWHRQFDPATAPPDTKAKLWTAGHALTIMARLERDVFPWLGDRPIAEIKAPELLMALRRVESRGALETAHRIRTVCGQVFRYAVATGRAERDISADLRGALPPVAENHHPAIIEPAKIADLLRTIDGYQGGFVVKCALRLAPLFFVRPGELRAAEWSEFDLDAGEWNIPAERMKMKQPHLVPLSQQSVDILRELHALTGTGRYVFPSGRSSLRCMSNNAVNAALRRLGYDKDEMCGHGFRAMARTILDEVLSFPADICEHQLAHAVKDPLGRAYNRTTKLPQRRKMMQTWADYLDGLKKGAKIIPLEHRKARG